MASSSGSFVGVCRALYVYAAQTGDELGIAEGDMLYVLDKGGDGWWRVKKKVEADDDGPEGLVPENYVEAIQPLGKAKALYDYEAQTEEEASFAEDAVLEVYDRDDPDWYLVRYGDAAYGFAPSNYLESIVDGVGGGRESPVQDVEFDQEEEESEDEEEQRRPGVPVLPHDAINALPPINTTPTTQRPRGDSDLSPVNAYSNSDEHYALGDSGKFQTWQVQEVDKRRRRKKGTLGIGNGQIIYATDSEKQPVQQWAISSLVHYSTERKHVFIDVSYPPAAAQFDFRVESSQVAQEITAALADAAGAARASGLREIAEASGDPIPPLPSDSALAKHHRRVQSPDEDGEEEEDYDDNEGQDDDDRVMAIAVYDFDAQGEDELSLTQDMRVEVVDDQKSDEWWKCRAADGREGVVPSSYVEKIRRRRGADRPKRKKQQHQHQHQETALSRALMQEPSGVGKRDRARAKSESSAGQSSRKPEDKAECKWY